MSQLFERASQVIPGGVTSPVRAFRSWGGEPYFVAHGQVAYVTDTEGNRFLDYVQSYGPESWGTPTRLWWKPWRKQPGKALAMVLRLKQKCGWLRSCVAELRGWRWCA